MFCFISLYTLFPSRIFIPQCTGVVFVVFVSAFWEGLEWMVTYLFQSVCCYICFHHLLLYHNESESGKRKTLCQNWLLSLLLYSASMSSRAEPEVLCIGNLQRVNIDSYSGTENDIHVGQYHCIMQFACAPPFLQKTYTHMNHSFKVLLPTL